MAANKGGRPSSYRPEFAEQAYKLSLLGATDGVMADFFGVSEVTFNAWKHRDLQFLEAITRGKLMADAVIAESLYHRAKGYSHESVKIFNNDGVALIVPYTERFPPDTQAASLWLRNRQPRLWRDKQEFEHTHKDAPADQLSDEELERIASRGRNGAPAPEKGEDKPAGMVH